MCPWFLRPGFILLLELTVVAVFAFGPTCCVVERTKHVLISQKMLSAGVESPLLPLAAPSSCPGRGTRLHLAGCGVQPARLQLSQQKEGKKSKGYSCLQVCPALSAGWEADTMGIVCMPEREGGSDCSASTCHMVPVWMPDDGS